MVAGVSTIRSGSSRERMRVFGSVMAQSVRARRSGRADRAGRLLHVADAHARRARGVVGQQEVLAQREAHVVGRHVDAAQVAVALEDDAEHVVGLALAPLGALPEEGDRGQSRVVARQVDDDDAQPVGRGVGPEVVDDLHASCPCPRRRCRPAARKRRSGSSWSVRMTSVTAPARDADLGRVVALRDRPCQLLGEGGLEAALQGGIDGVDSLGRLRRRPERSGR